MSLAQATLVGLAVWVIAAYAMLSALQMPAVAAAIRQPQLPEHLAAMKRTYKQTCIRTPPAAAAGV